MTSLSLYLLCAFIGLFTYLLYRLKRRLNYWQSLGIPCEEPHLIKGNMTDDPAKASHCEFFMRYYAKFKGTKAPFAGFYWFHRISVFALDPALIKNILIKDFHNFTDRGFYTNPEDDPLTGHLFMLDGAKWKNMRQKLTPTFTSGKMKYMFPTVVQVGNELVKVLDETIKINAVLEVRDILARFATDVIGSSAFGLDCNSLKNPNCEFRAIGTKALTEQRVSMPVMVFVMIFPDLARKLHIKITLDEVEAFYIDLVRKTISEREKHNIRRNDFMDILIDVKNNKESDDSASLTINEMAAQAFVFLFAGYETSSTTMAFALYELAQNQDIQQRAREEIDNVLELHNGELTYESMTDMLYLDQVISETLRLYSVLPVLNRVCLEDYVVPDNPSFVIKKGMNVSIPICAIHRDANYYSNPNTFDPDNFAADLVKQRDSILYLPFGEGPRNCIGMRFGKMQTRIGLALLLKHYKFSVCEKTQIPIVYKKKSFFTIPDEGIYLKVEKLV